MCDTLDIFWDNKTKQEKEQIWEELNDLCRSKDQEIQTNDSSIKERIEEIRRKWPVGGI